LNRIDRRRIAIDERAPASTATGAHVCADRATYQLAAVT
jgi:hypothetical protein